jgi:hypothetical protein
MARSGKKDRADREFAEKYLRLALELAYVIHANKDVAFFVVEDAWREFEVTLGRRVKEQRRQPKGFWREGERARPLHTKIWLSQEHILQWLVYFESTSWELQTERGVGLYQPNEEDLLLRFIKYLLQIALHRNSFYVTLGFGRLLYDYKTPQVTDTYGHLTKDDTRLKDDPYLRSRKVLLINELLERFQDMIQPETTDAGKRFQSQPTTDELVQFVRECLRRFIPWDIPCLVRDGFDPGTLTTGLHPSHRSTDDEDRLEINRVHTVVHPDCFSQIVKAIGLEPLEKRLAAPKFFYSGSGAAREDRFRPLELTLEDHVRLRRIWDSPKFPPRRKKLSPQQVTVYVNDKQCASFDPRRTARVQFHVGAEAQVIKVRGEDADGEVPLATLIVCADDIPAGEAFRDRIVLEGGQKVTIQLTPIRDASGELEQTRVDVSYAETQPVRAVSWLARRAWFRLIEIVEGSGVVAPGYSWLVKAGGVAALVVAIAFIWFQLWPSPELPSPPRAKLPPAPEIGPLSPTPPVTPPVRPPSPREPAQLMARLAWNEDPAAVLQAVPIETPRGTSRTIDLSGRETTVLISLPIYNQEGQLYTQYRVSLMAQDESIWQQTLRAPQPAATARAHILTVTVFPQQLPEGNSYRLQAEGQTRSGWQALGHLRLRSTER